MIDEEKLQINPHVYQWTGRALSILESVLKINIKLHHQQGQIENGEIFVFNHFARFETFVPQYLIYRTTGALSRSVAAAEFFRTDDAFSRYLRSLGAVPTDLPNIFSFLAREVLRGRKVVVFPEGGMVKDRRVLDSKGRYSVYSRMSMERRRLHTGAAVLALAVEAAKRGVLAAREQSEEHLLEAWTTELGLDSVEDLLQVARRPTGIVPANITFYPIRSGANRLSRVAEWFVKGIEPRMSEELSIEGNLLFTDTDMDIRLEDPVFPAEYLSGWDRRLMRRVGRNAQSVQQLVETGPSGAGWTARWWARRMRRASLRIRDAYMVAMYSGVTVNLSHLAALTIDYLLGRGATEIESERFRRLLYLAVKQLQKSEAVHHHRSLRSPASYAELLSRGSEGLRHFLESGVELGLLEVGEEVVRFLPKLRQEFSFDEVRIENPIAVYANEVAPVPAARRAVEGALRQEPEISAAELARLRFDDEVRDFRWDRERYSAERFQEINAEEPATASGEPRLWVPDGSAGLPGVLAVHGFTASPAEVEPLAQTLVARGFPVLAVRLKGHGTSPWDLLGRSWYDWLESVRRGFEILRDLAGRVAVVGFSGGGALALCLAAEHPPGLQGVVSVSAPLKVRDRSLSLVPLMHRANMMVDVLATGKGLKLFHLSHPEHPHINYRRMPIRALYELSHLMDALKKTLPAVRCPVLVIQGEDDPTVEPSSAQMIYDLLGCADKELLWVPSDRHGLLYENIGGIHDDILRFLWNLPKTSLQSDRAP